MHWIILWMQWSELHISYSCDSKSRFTFCRSISKTLNAISLFNLMRRMSSRRSEAMWPSRDSYSHYYTSVIMTIKDFWKIRMYCAIISNIYLFLSLSGACAYSICIALSLALTEAIVALSPCTLCLIWVCACM